MPTAGILVIGNEILSGKVIDTNSPYLCRELRALGVDVERILTIPDVDRRDRARGARDERGLRLRVHLGRHRPDPRRPHDGRRRAGLRPRARALASRSSRASSARRDARPNESQLKMAMIPAGASLVDAGDLWFPVVIVENVYVFPGVPELLRKKFESIRERFRGEPFLLKNVYVTRRESDIAAVAERAAAEFPELLLGSYPRIDEETFHVLLTLESRDAGYLGARSTRCCARLAARRDPQGRVAGPRPASTPARVLARLRASRLDAASLALARGDPARGPRAALARRLAALAALAAERRASPAPRQDQPCALVLAGFLAGPALGGVAARLGRLRDAPRAGSPLLAALLFVATAWLGRRLEHGALRWRDASRRCSPSPPCSPEPPPSERASCCCRRRRTRSTNRLAAPWAAAVDSSTPSPIAPIARWRSQWSASTRQTIASTIGTARGSTQGSWRPCGLERRRRAPSRSTVCCGRRIVAVGLKATRTHDRLAVADAALHAARAVARGARPAVRRRARRDRCARSRSGACRRSRCRSRSPSRPAATSAPCARSASSLSNTGSPSPAGTPRATHSTTPPSESPRAPRGVDALAPSRAAASASGQRTGFASTCRERHARRRRPSPRRRARCAPRRAPRRPPAAREQLARDRAGRDAADRLARARAAAALPVADAVLRLGGEVGVRGAVDVLHVPRRRSGARPRCARAARSACRASGPRRRPRGSRRGRPPGAAW